jgi:hypothetical protein
MTSLITSSALSAIGSFGGNRMMRYALDNKPSLKKFNTHDCLAVGVGAVTPVILAHIFKSSLRSITGFHGVAGFVIAGALTYLFNKKEKNDSIKQEHSQKEKSDLTEITLLLDNATKQASNNIAEIFDKENDLREKHQKSFLDNFNAYKNIDKNDNLTKEELKDRIDKIINPLKKLKTAYQEFKESFNNSDFSSADQNDIMNFDVKVNNLGKIFDAAESIDKKFFKSLTTDIFNLVTRKIKNVMLANEILKLAGGNNIKKAMQDLGFIPETDETKEK